MRICLGQTRIRAAALAENFKSMESTIQEAHTEQADLIVFPEMSLPGYFVGDSWERSSFLRQCDEYVQRIAALSTRTPIIFGSVGIDGDAKNEDGRVRKYNAAFVAQQGRLLLNPQINLPFWPKTLLPNYREFDDSRHFFDLRKLALERNVPLPTLLRPVQIVLPSGRTIHLGIGICEDAWAEDYDAKPYDLLCSEEPKPDLLINMSCSPFTRGKSEKRRRLFKKIAQKNNCPIVYVNSVGTQNNGKTVFTFDGDSGLYTPSGSFETIAEPFTPSSKTISLPPHGTEVRTAQSSFERNQSQIGEIQEALEAGLRFIKEEWKLDKIVIGISGGIDSALSAVLHARVFGSQNVFCVNMPSQFNSSLTIEAAHKLAKNLGCCYASLPIRDAVTLTLQQLESARLQGFPIPSSMPSLVQENIQARDRGSRLLASVASGLAAVFPCNANKSEITVGYSTLYGDHAGYLVPLGDLWKSQIYELSHYYNQNIFNQEIIPKETLNVVPSAELSASQDVTQGCGDPLCYPYHDALFRLWIEEWNRFDFNSTLAAYDDGQLGELIGADAQHNLQKLFRSREEFKADLLRWWNAYSGLGAFKRVQAPPILALSRRAFGFDHREAVGLPSR